MKRISLFLSMIVLVCTVGFNALALDSSTATALDDFESYTASDDLVFNWYVQPSNEKCGTLSLDTSSMMHGKNALQFAYSMKGAQANGKSWCTINFVPNDTKATFGDGIKFTAKSDNHVVARICVIDIDYTYKQYFFDITTDAKDYVIRWSDFSNIPGCKTFDPATSKGIASMDIAIISDNQLSDFKGEGNFWFDDLCTFTGGDETTPSGKAMEAQSGTYATTAAVTTKEAAATTPAAAASSQGEATTAATTTTIAGSSASTTTTVSKSSTTTTTAKTEATAGSASTTETGGGHWWIFVIIGVVVLAGAGAALYYFVVLKKKKKVE